MYAAFAACRLVCAVRAFVQSGACVLQQSVALRARRFSVPVATAIQGYHARHGALFSFDIVHNVRKDSEIVEARSTKRGLCALYECRRVAHLFARDAEKRICYKRNRCSYSDVSRFIV